MIITTLTTEEKKLIIHPFFDSVEYKSQLHINKEYHDIAVNKEAKGTIVCCSNDDCNKKLNVDIYTICRGFCIKCFLDRNASHYDNNGQIKEVETSFPLNEDTLDNFVMFMDFLNTNEEKR